METFQSFKVQNDTLQTYFGLISSQRHIMHVWANETLGRPWPLVPIWFTSRSSGILSSRSNVQITSVLTLFGFQFDFLLRTYDLQP